MGLGIKNREKKVMSANGGCFETMLAACDHADIGGFDHPSVGIAWSTLKAMIEELQAHRAIRGAAWIPVVDQTMSHVDINRAMERTDLFINRNRDSKWWT